MAARTAQAWGLPGRELAAAAEQVHIGPVLAAAAAEQVRIGRVLVEAAAAQAVAQESGEETRTALFPAASAAQALAPST